MHIHNWKWSDKHNHWACTVCGEVITWAEFKVEYGKTGNLDVDPIAGLNRLSAMRIKRQNAHQTRAK